MQAGLHKSTPCGCCASIVQAQHTSCDAKRSNRFRVSAAVCHDDAVSPERGSVKFVLLNPLSTEPIEIDPCSDL